MRRIVAAALLVAACLVAPALLQGGYLGSPGAETMGHAWVRAWSAAAWPGAPTGTDWASGAENWPVIDPVPTWIFAGVARILGDLAGWNLGVAAGIAVTSLGGAALARSVGGSGLFGALATPLMPIYLGSLQSGLTEDHFLGVLACSIAFAIQRRWFLAGILAGLAALCGLYLGWLALLSLAVLALVRAREVLRDALGVDPGSSPARGIRGLLAPFGGLALAAAIAMLAAAPFRAQLTGGDVVRPPPVPHEEHWRLNPWRGADLASFVSPGKDRASDAALREHPAYLGAATVALAVLGGWSPAVLAVVGCGAAAMGDEFVVAGTPTGVPNPAVLVLHALPMGDRFRNHTRIMLLGQLILVALASRGAARLRPSWGPRAAAGLVVAEVILLSPAAVPPSVTPAEVPAIYSRLPPSDLPLRVVGAQNPQAPLFHQRYHGHRLLNDPNRPPPLPRAGAPEVVVAFGDLAILLPASLGPPDAVEGDGAAWWP